MKMIILASVILSTLYTSMTHPVGFLILILAQALLVCLLSWILIKSSWFSFIIFLIFLGGLMVLFIYITSLASNEVIYSLSYESMLNTTLISSMPITYVLLSSKETMVSPSTELEKLFFMMYNPSFTMLVVFSMVYLLLTLIIVVKIADQFDAPIKNIN